MTFAISAQAASSELQNPFKMVSETLSELPKTLPRAPREVPGASKRPLRSGPGRFQRHLSSARDLRSTSEVALRAFRARFGCKLRVPSLLFFVCSCPWPLLSGLVWSVFCCFCSTLLRFCAFRFVGLSLLRRCSCCFCSECQRRLSCSLQRKCKPTCKRRSHEAT